MTLLLILTDQGHRLALISTQKTVWLRSRSRDPFPLLERGLRRQPDGKRSMKVKAVICGLPSIGGQLTASWSTVRAAIALCNSLAFAWGVPVEQIEVNGDESSEELAGQARRRAAKAKPGNWIKAKYSGKPNITKAKGKL